MARGQASVKGQKREGLKRRSRWLLAGAAVAALGALVVTVLLGAGRLPIRTIEVRSDLAHIDTKVLRDAVAPGAKAGFLAVDVNQVRQSIEALPWVAKASVRRVWPDRLVVEVTEQQPVARWGKGGLVNASGQIFTPPVATVPKDLAVLDGPDGTAALMARTFGEFNQALAPLGLHIARVQLNDRRAWRLDLENGLHLRLGREDLQGRLTRFVSVYNGTLKPHLADIDVVDLRYTNGLAVRWRSGVAPASV